MTWASSNADMTGKFTRPVFFVWGLRVSLGERRGGSYQHLPGHAAALGKFKILCSFKVFKTIQPLISLSLELWKLASV